MPPSQQQLQHLRQQQQHYYYLEQQQRQQQLQQQRQQQQRQQQQQLRASRTQPLGNGIRYYPPQVDPRFRLYWTYHQMHRHHHQQQQQQQKYHQPLLRQQQQQQQFRHNIQIPSQVHPQNPFVPIPTARVAAATAFAAPPVQTNARILPSIASAKPKPQETTPASGPGPVPLSSSSSSNKEMGSELRTQDETAKAKAKIIPKPQTISTGSSKPITVASAGPATKNQKVERASKSAAPSVPPPSGSALVKSGPVTESLGEGVEWPRGWTKTTRKRLGGKSAGTYDSYWHYEFDNGRQSLRFRSIPEVQQFLLCMRLFDGDVHKAKQKQHMKEAKMILKQAKQRGESIASVLLGTRAKPNPPGTEPVPFQPGAASGAAIAKRLTQGIAALKAEKTRPPRGGSAAKAAVVNAAAAAAVAAQSHPIRESVHPVGTASVAKSATSASLPAKQKAEPIVANSDSLPVANRAVRRLPSRFSMRTQRLASGQQKNPFDGNGNGNGYRKGTTTASSTTATRSITPPTSQEPATATETDSEQEEEYYFHEDIIVL